MSLLRRPRRWMLSLVVLAAVIGGSARAQNHPPAAPAADPQAELARLADQVSRLDPKAPAYAARIKAVLEELIRVNQALARENAALRAQQASASLAPRPKKTRASGGATSTRVAGAAPAAGAAPSAQTGPLFGKRGLKKYHRAGCTFGERIKNEDRVYFATPAAAQAAGYDACKVCHPEAFTPAAPAGPKSP